jgi:glycopeptide antibiotics resistance protein
LDVLNDWVLEHETAHAFFAETLVNLFLFLPFTFNFDLAIKKTRKEVG